MRLSVGIVNISTNQQVYKIPPPFKYTFKKRVPYFVRLVSFFNSNFIFGPVIQSIGGEKGGWKEGQYPIALSSAIFSIPRGSRHFPLLPIKRECRASQLGPDCHHHTH
jgi:hypothetical protein